jgi:hypothetical protein
MSELELDRFKLIAYKGKSFEVWTAGYCRRGCSAVSRIQITARSRLEWSVGVTTARVSSQCEGERELVLHRTPVPCLHEFGNLTLCSLKKQGRGIPTEGKGTFSFVHTCYLTSEQSSWAWIFMGGGSAILRPKHLWGRVTPIHHIDFLYREKLNIC